MFGQYLKKKIKEKKSFGASQYFFTFLGLIILFWLAVPLLRTARKQIAIRSEISALQKQKEKFAAKNSELKKLLEYLKSDEYIEEQARIKLNYKKEGENLVVIKGQENSDNNDNDIKTDVDKNIIKKFLDKPPANKEDNISNPQRWWRYFFVS